MTNPEHPIVILGAGVAGLAAAWRLAHTVTSPIVVLEQAEQVGGLARTLDLSGMRVDLGSHRIHPGSLIEVLELLRRLLGQDLLQVQRRGRIRLKGRFIAYPPSPSGLLRALGPLEAIRCGMTWMLQQLSRCDNNGSRGSTSYESYLRSSVGSRLYELFYAPYARKVYGIDPDHLSVKAAKKRITTGSPWRFASGLILGSQRNEGAPSSHFYYPANGFGSIPDALLMGAVTQGVQIDTGVRIHRLSATAHRINEVVWESAEGVRTMPAKAVISTIPLGGLASLIHPSAPEDVSESAAALHWRGIRLLQVGVKRQRCLDGETYYFPEECYPFGRISEPNLFSPRLGRSTDGTAMNIEVICSPGDQLWLLDEASFLRRIMDQIEELGLFRRQEIFAFRSIRLPIVYPVCVQGFQDRLERLLDYAESFGNLYSIGRGGQFFHGNIDHSIMMGLEVADHLSRAGACSVGWRKGTPHDQFQVRD